MRSGDVDTGKFASWPLLRPDELAALSSEVLKASLTSLDLLCDQTPDEDAIANYGRRQRERTTSILSERAAQVRVRALLAAGTPASLGLAPSHEILPSDGASRHEADVTSTTTTELIHGSEEGRISPVQSPPRARFHLQHKADPASGTQVATSPETFDTAVHGRESGHKQDGMVASIQKGGDRKHDPDDSTPQRCAPERSSGHLSKQDVSGGGQFSDANRQNTDTSRLDTGTGRQNRGQPSIRSVVHEKWGSVFVVGGGQRRRRASVRRRSVEAEDTPAARRAHVDKERQERRKASLCRLLARKEKRALQQETRRRRRAAASRATAPAAAAAAAEEAKAVTTAANTAKSEQAEGVTSKSATGTTKSPSYGRPCSPTNSVKASENNSIANGPTPIPASVPASLPSRAWSVDANAPERELDAGGRMATESSGSVRDKLGVEQSCGSVRSEAGVEAVAETYGVPICAGNGKDIPDVMTAECDLSSSESESVSGGDSSDNDFSADEGGEQKGSSVAPVGHKERVQLETDGGGGDANGLADGQRVAVPEADGDLTLLRKVLHAKVEVVARVTPSNHTRQKYDEVTPATPLSPGRHCHEEGNSDSGRDVTAAIEVGHRFVGQTLRDDDDVPQQMDAAATAAVAAAAAAAAAAATAAAADDAVVPPRTDISSTAADVSEEGSGTDTQSDTEWDNNSGSAVGINVDGVVDLPDLLGVGPLRSSSAGVTRYSESPTRGFGQPQSLDVQFGLRSGEVKRRRNGSISGRRLPSARKPVLSHSGNDTDAVHLAADRTSAVVEVEGAVRDAEQGFTEPCVCPHSCSRHRVPRSSATALPGPCRSGEDRADANVSYASAASAAEGISSTRSSGNGCMVPGPPCFVSLGMTSTSTDNAHDTQHQRQHLTTDSETLSASVKPSLDGRRSRRTSDALKDQQPGAGQPTTETDHTLTPRPKEVPIGGRRGCLEDAIVNRSSGPVAVQGRHRTKSLSCMPPTTGGPNRDNGGNSPPCRLFGVGYTEFFPKISAILSAYHNGRALTREGDCRSLPLTSSIMARGRGGGGGATGLTSTEEEACLQLQLKLYAIYVRVIKDYAAVFSFGDEWPTSGSEGPSSLVYSGDPSALHYRVNSKARPEVYNIVTDVLNNRCEQWEELPTGLGLKTTWNLLWTWSKPHIQYSSLLVWQKVNHFPNSRELTRKDLLNKHISRFMAPGGRLASEFHIMPQTFVLPHEFTTFVAAFTSSGQYGRDRAKSRGDNPAGVGIDSSDDSRGEEWGSGEAGAIGGVGRRENVWIMKPVGMSRGRGIRLIDDIKNISYADKVVLQRYIGNPLLLDGYKFDLRLYVLVTSFNPLEAFIYKEGFARVSTHLYEKGDIGNPFIHLTNSSVQRLNESGATRDSPLHHANVSEAGGTKTTLSYLWRRLKAKGVDIAALWAGICSVVVKSLVCVEGAIPNQPNSFEVFGYDVLIDDKLRPWLIEVNASPSMARDSHIDRQVKEALIIDTVHLIDPLPFDRQKLADVLEKRLKTFDNSKAWSFKERRASETFEQRNSSAFPFDGENGAKPSVHGARPRRTKDEVELDRDLNQVLRGRRPRQVGELPAHMGNFSRLCPATAAHRHAKRLRRRVIRPKPGDDSFDTNQ